jgi:hypothetical protein
MPFPARAPLIVTTMLWLAACRPAPSSTEALAALRRSNPALDTSTVRARVWQDGPPWFSCAEVIAKLRSAADSAAVRDQVGNWRSLLLAEWIVLRDTAKGEVSDPGWCAVHLTDEPGRRSQGWIPIASDSFPTGDARRGWSVPVGRQRLSLEDAPRALARDTARVDYLVTVAPNANGKAIGAEHDTLRYTARLVQENEAWRVIQAGAREP